MLTDKDILMIKETRDEIINNRRRPITFFVEGTKKRNPLTGAWESGDPAEHEVLSVVTDRTSRVAAERRIKDQAETIEGDIWFSVSIEELNRIGLVTYLDTEKITHALHNGVKYAVVSRDPKGIGEYNRYEFVGKRVN